MSVNLQKSLAERRSFGRKSIFPCQLRRTNFEGLIYSDGFTISQMTLKKCLPGHTGCVNTLDWSLNGDKLLSGSDDTKLNIYLPFENYKLSTVIDTGHHANIFTAKFMPQTSENVIVSGAGDSEIRIFDLHNPEAPLFSMYACHSDQVKKVCVYNDNPNEFFTCSQDGTVRHFDIRVPHLCSPHSIKSFMTAQIKPSKQSPLPKGVHIEEGCSHPIVDYGKHNIELNSMTLNNVFPQYFAVAGTNDYIYLHDRRMTQAACSSKFDKTFDTNCVRRFSPRLDAFDRLNMHITSCKFSDAKGCELIGSWSSDAIYLFNINDDVLDSSGKAISSSPTLDLNSSPKFNNDCCGDFLPEDTKEETDNTLWEKTIYYFTRHDLSNALFYSAELLHSFEKVDKLDAELGKCCAYMIRATVLASNDNLDQSSAIKSTTSREQIMELIEKGEMQAPGTWFGLLCKAVGYWLIGGGFISNGFELRESFVKISMKYALTARSQLQIQLNSSLNDKLLSDNSANDRIYMDMINRFITDVNSVIILEGYSDNMEQETNVRFGYIEARCRRYEWIHFMNVDRLPSCISELSTLVSAVESTSTHPAIERRSSLATLDINDSNGEPIFAPNTRAASTDIFENERQEAYATEQSLQNRFIGSPQLLDINTHGDTDDSGSEDFDMEAFANFDDEENCSVFDEVDVVKPRSKFTGHCNIETVKDVEFFGLQDEYIMSGSDKGYLFIWDKKTGKIVQILRADEEVVNVAKGHPYLPMIAVSGIDSTVKIFEPTSRLPSTSRAVEPDNPRSYSTSSRLYKRAEIVEANRQSNDTYNDEMRMTRNMYTAVLRLERQRRLEDSEAYEEEEEEDDD